MKPATGRVVADLLSLLRPVLGVVILAVLADGRDCALVAPAALAACASDYLDGSIARSAGVEDRTGRLLDGACDAGFLALAFAGLAMARVWSGPSASSLAWFGLDLLPLWALAVSFGVYWIRVLAQQRRGQEAARSVRGHRAGIANYALVLVGAVEVWPGVQLPTALLRPACVVVAALNFASVGENLVLLFPPPDRGPTMPA